jgi:hypothetical protein
MVCLRNICKNTLHKGDNDDDDNDDDDNNNNNNNNNLFFCVFSFVSYALRIIFFWGGEVADPKAMYNLC